MTGECYCRQLKFLCCHWVTVGDSGLCCVCLMSFRCKLIPLCVDSVWALRALFCFRLWEVPLECKEWGRLEDPIEEVLSTPVSLRVFFQKILKDERFCSRRQEDLIQEVLSTPVSFMCVFSANREGWEVLFQPREWGRHEDPIRETLGTHVSFPVLLQQIPKDESREDMMIQFERR